MAVALAPCADKLHLDILVFHLSRTEIAEHRYVGLASEPLFQCVGHLDAAAHNHHVDVVRGTFQKQVAHISAHHIALHPQRVCGIAYFVKNVLVKNLCQFGIGIYPHFNLFILMLVLIL